MRVESQPDSGPDAAGAKAGEPESFDPAKIVVPKLTELDMASVVARSKQQFMSFVPLLFNSLQWIDVILTAVNFVLDIRLIVDLRVQQKPSTKMIVLTYIIYLVLHLAFLIASFFHYRKVVRDGGQIAEALMNPIAQGTLTCRNSGFQHLSTLIKGQLKLFDKVCLFMYKKLFLWFESLVLYPLNIGLVWWINWFRELGNERNWVIYLKTGFLAIRFLFILCAILAYPCLMHKIKKKLRDAESTEEQVKNINLRVYTIVQINKVISKMLTAGDIGQISRETVQLQRPTNTIPVQVESTQL
jgi:hypothetical protein